MSNAKKYKVTVAPHGKGKGKHPRPVATFAGLPPLEAGKTHEVEMTESQAAALNTWPGISVAGAPDKDPVLAAKRQKLAAEEKPAKAEAAAPEAKTSAGGDA